jgi:NAD(P)-dependent dehydrogenase (short-subunit alcohol dehydrogenase family)
LLQSSFFRFQSDLYENLPYIIMATASYSLSGKKAIVLGGTSGIGLATCRQLVQAGADVIACSRSQDKCDAANAELTAVVGNEGGGSFTALSLDVLDRPALDKLFEQHEGFDYLVAAATGGSRALGPFLEMDPDGFQKSFAKLWGYANAVRFGAPHMKQSGGASIVLVSGSPAKKCKPGYVALSCVGAAVENLVRALAKELSSKKIRINGVSPGLVDTPMFDGKGDGKADFLAKSTADNPVPRAGTAEEVASGILFALTNEFVSGTIVDVDGGMAVP